MKQNPLSTSGIPVRTSMRFSRLFNNKWLLLLLLTAFASGCKKVNEEQGMIGVCPIISATSPDNNAVNVSINTMIDATFNEVMDPSSITSTSFTLMQGTTPVLGSVSYSGVTAIFTPSANLQANTTFTAMISKGVKDPAGNAMINDHVWSFTTGVAPDVTRPTIISTDPVHLAVDVVLSKIISAGFSEPMNSLTINETTFIIRQGLTLVAGGVTYADSTAVFSPLVALSSNTVYTVTITTGVQDLAGNAMAGDSVWSFTTENTSDIIAPTVMSTDPANADNNVEVNKIIGATFSEVMNQSTINDLTFTIKQGATPVLGLVTYSGSTAVFTPAVNFFSGTTYTATITTGAQDVGGNALANNYVWTFTTTELAPSVFLGTAAQFGVFGGSAGITNDGLNTVINNGSIGTTAASTLITGFHDGTTGDIYTETPLNVGNVTGRIHTAPPAPGTAISFVIATNALMDAINAYNSISPASRPGGIDPGAGELGGLTLSPGIYKSASGTFNITNGDLTLDAMGDPNAEWIFQTAAGLTVGIAGPAGARSVKLINGAQAKNVYWYVGSAATINGAGGGVMTGTIISSAGVTFSTVGNTVQTVLNGRAISLNASVTLANTTINIQ